MFARIITNVLVVIRVQDSWFQVRKKRNPEMKLLFFLASISFFAPWSFEGQARSLFSVALAKEKLSRINEF